MMKLKMLFKIFNIMLVVLSALIKIRQLHNDGRLGGTVAPAGQPGPVIKNITFHDPAAQPPTLRKDTRSVAPYCGRKII